MRLIAKLLFSITILLAVTPALAKGDGGEDRSIAAEVQNSKLAEYYYYRGNVYYHMDKYDDAITDYDLAIKLRRNYADAYYNRGLAFDGKGLLQQALGDLRKALTCNAFSISASKWTGNARAKIIEIETKLSEAGNLQAQTSATSVDETLVK
jgi:tetratricopeptide (TPR) repeat protein